jgi:hypothetical protein
MYHSSSSSSLAVTDWALWKFSALKLTSYLQAICRTSDRLFAKLLLTHVEGGGGGGSFEFMCVPRTGFEALLQQSHREIEIFTTAEVVSSVNL